MTGALTFGEALGVLSPTGSGRLRLGSPLTLSVAGAEFNVAVGLARLGIPTTFAGAVGSDATGRLILQTLKAEGVGVQDVTTRPEPTGHFMKEWYGLRPEPHVYYLREGSAMRAWRVPSPVPDSWRHMDWIHTTAITWMLGQPLAQQAQKLLETLAGTGASVISLDLNVRRKLGPLPAWRSVVERMLPYAAVVFAGQAEMEGLWDISHGPDLWARGFLQREQVLIVKNGPNGSQAYQDERELAAAAIVPVGVVQDVVGAGDGFAAGVIAGRLKSKDWRESLRLGHLVAAFSVAHPGDWEGYPLWDEVLAHEEGRWVDR